MEFKLLYSTNLEFSIDILNFPFKSFNIKEFFHQYQKLDVEFNFLPGRNFREKEQKIVKKLQKFHAFKIYHKFTTNVKFFSPRTLSYFLCQNIFLQQCFLFFILLKFQKIKISKIKWNAQYALYYIYACIFFYKSSFYKNHELQNSHKNNVSAQIVCDIKQGSYKSDL